MKYAVAAAGVAAAAAAGVAAAAAAAAGVAAAAAPNKDSGINIFEMRFF